MPRIAAAEAVDVPGATGGTCRHVAVLSLTPGDFDNVIGPPAGPSLSVTIPFAVGPDNVASGYTYGSLPPNTKCYFNIRNAGDAETDGGVDGLLYPMYCDLSKNSAG
jgi:hypothetical protein